MAVMIIQLVNIILSLTVRHDITKIVRLAAAGIYVNNHLLKKNLSSCLDCPSGTGHSHAQVSADVTRRLRSTDACVQAGHP